ncbi:PilN domain-containing protein [Planomicrobium sp. CPCC 101110]|uniref:PilN domain-containing protein n=1 Tax=Planomicrobium sp. CPCC 101110 TaxID=2599619 RepID=UPI0011B82641|nr:fimbrial assembly protein [Planomicrobium sp. CPCC 101110]TWT26267.1 fimbrial assembly protein [Planomicrobium sp. CPCC 101110]
MLVDINLLPQKERDRPAFIVAAISILVLAVIIWAVFAFLANANEKEGAALAAQSAEIAAEQGAIRQQLEATQGMNEEQQLKATVDWAESYQFDTLPLLGELVSKLPERGFFDSFSYTGMDQAALTVQFDTAREAAYYLTQLKASELLASAKLDSVTQQEVAAESAEDGAVDEDALAENPRYLATYTLVFVDERIPAETVEGEAVEGAPAATEAPAQATPAEPAAGETVPAEETPAAPATDQPDTEVNVQVNEETETAPTETEGDGQ